MAEEENEDFQIRPGATPLHVHAVMARRGLLPNQLVWFEDPERGEVNPLVEPEMQASVRVFMGQLARWLGEGNQ